MHRLSRISGNLVAVRSVGFVIPVNITFYSQIPSNFNIIYQ
jgi:hypothetical protein